MKWLSGVSLGLYRWEPGLSPPDTHTHTKTHIMIVMLQYVTGSNDGHMFSNAVAVHTCMQTKFCLLLSTCAFNQSTLNHPNSAKPQTLHALSTQLLQHNDAKKNNGFKMQAWAGVHRPSVGSSTGRMNKRKGPLLVHLSIYQCPQTKVICFSRPNSFTTGPLRAPGLLLRDLSKCNQWLPKLQHTYKEIILVLFRPMIRFTWPAVFQIFT